MLLSMKFLIEKHVIHVVRDVCCSLTVIAIAIEAIYVFFYQLNATAN